MRKIALLLVVLSAVAACKDGVTPDCTTDPSVCSPDDSPDDSGTTSPVTPVVDAGSDAGAVVDAAADADSGD